MKSIVCLFAILMAPPLSAAQISVDAKTVIFAAAGNGNPDPNGIVPVTIPLLPGADRVLVLTSVTGQVSPFGPASYLGADGGPFLGASYSVQGFGGIAGIRDSGTENVFPLTAVFTAGTPSAAARPATRDVTLERDDAVITALLNQPFVVGDGRWSGGIQTFLIPDEATGLSFGFADAFAETAIFHGRPGAYVDNVGRLAVNYTIIPEPATFTLCAIALGALGMRGGRRWRSGRFGCAVTLP